jgi:hypothetical protein
MSCLFDALAAALQSRASLVHRAQYASLRAMRVPVSGADLRAALCDRMCDARVHGASLAEWGAMETGGTPAAYVEAMRAASEWGGGVELAAFASAFRLPVRVESAMGTFMFGEKYANHAAAVCVRYDGSHYTLP